MKIANKKIIKKTKSYKEVNKPLIKKVKVDKNLTQNLNEI